MVTIKGESKKEIVKSIVSKFHGVISEKKAKAMVKNITEGKTKIDVKVPTWFRFRNAKGHFIKMGK